MTRNQFWLKVDFLEMLFLKRSPLPLLKTAMAHMIIICIYPNCAIVLKIHIISCIIPQHIALNRLRSPLKVMLTVIY